jgi:S-adenosylmethionine hydrolase
VLLGINPEAQIVDLSHGIAPQDVWAGALVLRQASRFFPTGTIHVAVVDPGVGSNRRPLLIDAGGTFFIGPDNGIFSLVLGESARHQIVELSNPHYHLIPKSGTFHGRDIFAPVAGYLSLGVPAKDFGEPVENIVKLSWPAVAAVDQELHGEIVYIDRFGNLITNLSDRDLKIDDPASVEIRLGDRVIRGLAKSYADGAGAELIAVVNSWGLLEIAQFSGNAQMKTGANVGDKVYVGKRETRYV